MSAAGYAQTTVPFPAVAQYVMPNHPAAGSFPQGDRPVDSAVDGLTRRLEGHVKRVWEQTNRARSIADDFFGPAGDKSNGVPAQQPALGRYSVLATNLDELDFALSSLSAQLDRLTCL